MPSVIEQCINLKRKNRKLRAEVKRLKAVIREAEKNWVRCEVRETIQAAKEDREWRRKVYG